MEPNGCGEGMSGATARALLAEFSDPERATHAMRFFKTGPGDYGEGDRFIGVTVPDVRKVERQLRGLPLAGILDLLASAIHEERLLALLLMVSRYDKGDEKVRQEVFETYLAHRDRINNWDLVDASAPYIFGRHVHGKGEEERLALARSERMWDRRIAMVSTLHSIRQGETAIVAQLAELLLNDRHDLMHKAVGWMLREAGKRDASMLERFLDRHAAEMPRTALRYAIERLPEERRKDYMSRKDQARVRPQRTS